MSMVAISVIIPVYNAEQTILETIASVQQQTFLDFELIVIDDGSTDQTLKLLDTVKDPALAEELKACLEQSHVDNGVAKKANKLFPHF